MFSHRGYSPLSTSEPGEDIIQEKEEAIHEEGQELQQLSEVRLDCPPPALSGNTPPESNVVSLFTPPATLPPPKSIRKLIIAYLLWLPPFGLLGLHRLYCGQRVFFLLYLFTAGNAGLGWLADLYRLPSLVAECNEQIHAFQQTGKTERKRNSFDAFILWLPPLGLLGAHRFYLGHYWMGLAWMFTAGNAVLGWLLDLLRLGAMAAEAEPFKECKCCISEFFKKRPTNSFDAFLLWLPPLGLLGAHRFYIGQWKWGLVWLLTAGNAGIGWFLDLCSLGRMVNDYEQERQGTPAGPNGFEAFKLWFPPLGIIGAHHAYLGRKRTAIVYLFTGGLACLGWLADFFLLPCWIERARKQFVAGQVDLEIGTKTPKEAAPTTYVVPVRTGTLTETGTPGFYTYTPMASSAPVTVTGSTTSTITSAPAPAPMPVDTQDPASETSEQTTPQFVVPEPYSFPGRSPGTHFAASPVYFAYAPTVPVSLSSGTGLYPTGIFSPPANPTL